MSHVLLVEDDRWLAESYASVLEKAHFVVTTVTNASEAMQVVEQGVPDVVVADVMLEGHTIFALLHELQSYDDTRTIPIILCSNAGSEQLQTEKLKSYGVVDVLSKANITPERLQEVVRQTIAT